MEKCNNIFMFKENPEMFLFVLHHIRPEDMDVAYECEFTVSVNGLHKTNQARTPFGM